MKKLFCRLTFQQYRHVTDIQPSIKGCIQGAWPNRKEERGQVLHSPETPRFLQSPSVKWPRSARSGTHTGGTERLGLDPSILWEFTRVLWKENLRLFQTIPQWLWTHTAGEQKQKLSEAGYMWQVEFYGEALIRTEVCQDNTAFGTNFIITARTRGTRNTGQSSMHCIEFYLLK